MTGSSSKGKPKVVNFDAQFRDIQAQGSEILQQALLATQTQRAFQNELFSLLEPEFARLVAESDLADQLGTSEQRAKFLRASIDHSTQLAGQSADLNKQLAEQTASLGTLTPEESQLISQAIGAARKIGTEQISQFIEGNFRAGNEVAAARGLRPTDAPVGNIRGRVAEEGVRQVGQLEQSLAGQQAEASLQVPLQRTALLGQIAGQQGQLSGASDLFQAGLDQNAIANRLNLTTSAAQTGLGLANIGQIAPGLTAASSPEFGTKSSTASGGISTRMLKKNGRSVDPEEVLARLQALPIEAWQYLWDHDEEEVFQIGPYAEDFQEAFGGERYRLSYLHALGVAMVSLQALTTRVERLERLLEN